jgi:hypothetical protein
VKKPANYYFTLHHGDFSFTYVLAHTDGREIFIQTDWQFPSIAALMGWSPCPSRCQYKCHGATDGTVDCAARSALDHILNAMAYLERNIGRRIPDVNGVFDYFEEDGYAS